MDWMLLLDQAAIPLLVAILTPIILMFVKRGLDLFERKADFQVSLDHLYRLEQLVLKGIAYAEEQAHKALKGDEAEPLAGETKLEMAIEFVKTNAKAMGIDTKTDDLAKLIESALFESRDKK